MPSVVFKFEIVGLEVELLQQTPREVIAAPPSPVIFPPLAADICVIEDIDVVDIPTGIVAATVVKALTEP